MAPVRTAAAVGGLFGLLLLSVIFARTDWTQLLHAVSLTGGKLLWLAPYRLVFFGLYALGWMALLLPYNTGKEVGFAYVCWVTAVREAIDRLLPVASIGGGVVGVRLVHLRGVPTVAASATVIVEVLLTLLALYVFFALGVALRIGSNGTNESYSSLLIALLLSLLVPLTMTLLLQQGTAFTRLEGLLRRMLGITMLSLEAASLDHEIKACLRRRSAISVSGTLQLAAMISGSFEIWFVLRVLGHPIEIKSALIMESLTQAVRHVAFVVPGGIGVQEAGLIAFGHAVGVGSDLALTVSFAKRIRELICGVPCLISWSLVEGGRLRSTG
ncbi:MAG TPA: lysylphosphatidylglycerol synthase domain-containing protein [Steroidobacteraceae bacterium]|jgi:putative membrane protein|nr:lysylphosphatidylglycerol synthase domain-containing protein [Steroidobacteraceae bacterium]